MLRIALQKLIEMCCGRKLGNSTELEVKGNKQDAAGCGVQLDRVRNFTMLQ